VAWPLLAASLAYSLDHPDVGALGQPGPIMLTSARGRDILLLVMGRVDPESGSLRVYAERKKENP
jgi:hypothetical protein